MISRRKMLACAPMALGACARAEENYFGNTRPPKVQHLVTTLDNEPPSLDPPLSSGLIDSLIGSMFEGLTNLQPATGMPMAALATHCEVAKDGLTYTFYLRGHLQPRGKRLPNTGDLPPEYSRHHAAPPDIVQHDGPTEQRSPRTTSCTPGGGWLMHELRRNSGTF